MAHSDNALLNLPFSNDVTYLEKCPLDQRAEILCVRLVRHKIAKGLAHVLRYEILLLSSKTDKETLMQNVSVSVDTVIHSVSGTLYPPSLVSTRVE